jgi:hypothetical protein
VKSQRELKARKNIIITFEIEKLYEAVNEVQGKRVSQLIA